MIIINFIERSFSVNTRHDMRSSRTQKSLCRALYEMIDEQPLSEITVTALTKRAEVSRATFYLYFDSIEAMASSIVSTLYSSFLDRVDSVLAEGKDFKDSCKSLLAHPFSDTEDIVAYRAMIRAGCIDEKAISNGIMEARKLFRAFFVDDAGTDELDYMLEFVAGGISLSLIRWARISKSSDDLGDFGNLLINILFRFHVHLNSIRRKQ